MKRVETRAVEQTASEFSHQQTLAGHSAASSMLSMPGVILPQLRKPKTGQVKQLAQDHTMMQ